MWKQKIYKSLFSILLTGICVTAVTYAASVSYIKDWEVLTEAYMTNLVSTLNAKANLADIYTKAQVDSKIQSLNSKITDLTNRLNALENSSTIVDKNCPTWYLFDETINQCVQNSICSISSCPAWFKLDFGICKCIPDNQSYR
mgnify:CR=1 FL=1